MSESETSERELNDAARGLEAVRGSIRKRAGYLSAAEVPPLGDDRALAQAADRADVSAHFPLVAHTPVEWGLALFRKVQRRALRWYINPVVDQQNAFNETAVRALLSVEARQRELLRRLEAQQAQQEPPSE